jgi:glycosyltransferase involved in cell wall biosynthesis
MESLIKPSQLKSKIKTVGIGKPITVVIIAQDAEINIERCIKSCRNLGEVLLIDSGSSDNTVEIARRLGAKVIFQPWLGFGPQKQFGIAKANTDWFLSLDSDEYLSETLLEEIQSLPLDDTSKAYKINRRSFFLGREVRFCGWNPDWVTRLGNRKHCNFTNDLVHEKLTGHASEATLPGLLYHNSYTSKADITKKIELYGRLGQRSKTFKKNRIAVAAWSFFRTYIIRLGIFDGFTGFQIALMNARTSYIKYTEEENSS